MNDNAPLLPARNRIVSRKTCCHRCMWFIDIDDNGWQCHRDVDNEGEGAVIYDRQEAPALEWEMICDGYNEVE